MSDAEPPPSEREPPRVKARLPFEQNPFGGGVRAVGTFLYALLALGLGGFAVYNVAVQGLPLTDPYVAAPAIGAVWFALRLFMMTSSRK